MKVLIKLEVLHRREVAVCAAHSFRTGEQKERIDASRTHLNRVLYGNRNATGALGELPVDQPDTGKSLQSNARLGVLVTIPLPSTISVEDDAQIRAWAEGAVQWLLEDCPGELAYAVLHMDEERPHIHAFKLAIVVETGRISYKAVFESKLVMGKQWNVSYERWLVSLIERQLDGEGASPKGRFSQEDAVSRRLLRQTGQLQVAWERVTEERDRLVEWLTRVLPAPLVYELAEWAGTEGLESPALREVRKANRDR